MWLGGVEREGPSGSVCLTLRASRTLSESLTCSKRPRQQRGERGSVSVRMRQSRAKRLLGIRIAPRTTYFQGVLVPGNSYCTCPRKRKRKPRALEFLGPPHSLPLTGDAAARPAGAPGGEGGSIICLHNHPGGDRNGP